MMEPPDEAPPPREARATTRLPYEAPAVLSEEVFETLALSCTSGTIACGPGIAS